MAVISLTKFSGVAPRVSPNKLTPEMAQTALNVRLLAGTLSAWKLPTTVLTGLTEASKSTIYRYGQDLVSDSQYWFEWPVDVDVVKGAIANDQTERTYFTHPTLGARITNNSLALTGGSGSFPRNSYPLGVPSPVITPIIAVQVTGDTTSSIESRVYIFTYVTSLGEEGPPSPPSNLLDVRTVGSTVRMTGLGTTAPSGYAGYITAKRIYRTLSGSLSTEYQLVDEIPIAQATYDDSILGSALNEVIPSITWTAPPSGCFGITQMANGILLLFKGYDIYPSEAYVPYAYPANYSLAVDYPIVGGKAIGTSAVILTTGHPYLLTGSDPSALSLVKLESPQSCSSKRSIAAASGGVIYASPDGLIFVSVSGQVQNMTEAMFSRDEWQALVPSSMSGYFHDGRYHGFYNSGAAQRGFIFDPSQGTGAFVFVDTYATAGFSDLLQDALYLKVGTNIVKWNSDAAKMTYTWKSAVFELGSPSNPACAQVVAKSYPVTFKLFADGTLKHTQTVANDLPFWLPSGYRARFLEIEISGTAEVLAVHVAASPQELKGV
jgi:hypothetical protein